MGCQEKECLAIIRAFKEYRTFFVGNFVTIYTDHQALTYILNGRRTLDGLTGRLFRWTIKLQEYKYEVKYMPGLKLTHADALSRSPFLVITKEDMDAVFSPEAYLRADASAYQISVVTRQMNSDRLQKHPKGDCEEVVSVSQKIFYNMIWTHDEILNAQAKDERINQMIRYKTTMKYFPVRTSQPRGG